MNKKLISVAVAAVFAAPMANAAADTTLYGRINNALVYEDADSKDQDQWDVEDNASRLGVKGSEDLGNGMKGIYQIELQMDTADGGATARPSDSNDAGLNGSATDSGFGTRLGYVGLTGGFGTAAIGRQWTPYYGSVDKTDFFNMPASNNAYVGLSRIGDAVSYVSPNFSGFTGALAIIASNDSNDVGEDFADAWNISGDYNNGPLSVGVSYVNVGGDATADCAFCDSDQWGIGASWKFGDMFQVIGQYEDNSDADWDSWAVAGRFFWGNNVISAKYGEKSLDATDVDTDETVVEFTHYFSKRTQVYAAYDLTSVDSATEDDDDTDRFGIGIRHDF